jgi:hypothetical protein
MEKIEMCKILRAFIIASACLSSPTLAADLPTTLTGTLANPPADTITFGTPSATATMTLNNHAALLNDGTWNAHAGTISPTYNYIGPTNDYAITNTGTLTIDAGAGIFRILDFTTNQPSDRSPDPRNLTFTNTGAVNLNSGSFYIAAPDKGSTSGTFTLAANTTLGLGGTLAFDADSTLTGAGNVLLSTDVRKFPSGSFTPNATNTPPAITFNGAYNVAGTTTIYGTSVTFNTDTTLNNLQVSDAGFRYPSTLAGTGTVTLTGSGTFTSTYTWTGGPSMVGSGIVFSSTGIPTGTTVSVHALLVTGTLNLNADGSILVDGTAITVAPGAALALGAGYFANHATITNNGLLVATNFAGTLYPVHGTPANPAIVLTNNNLIYVRKTLAMGLNTQFNNNGTVLVGGGGLFQPSSGTDSKTSVITIQTGATMEPPHPRTFTGTLNNAGSLRFGTDLITLSSDLTFNHTGSLEVIAGKVLLAAPQQAATTGAFAIEKFSSLPTGILEFATDYDFSSPTGPFFTHYASGDGLLIIDPGITLTLPLDTPFAGTIQNNGTLLIAPPLNPANLNMTPNFTILPTAVPEPTSLLSAALALPLALLRRPRRAR